MAFTASQEEILLQLIDAFKNGKKISDLPEVSGTNPFGLYAEVLDTDGESKKSSLAALLPYMEEQVAYGVDINLTTGEVTRVGNMDLHRTLPVQSRIRGCLLDDDGKVVEYLHPLSWLNAVRDGSRGQVMNEIPMYYFKAYYPSPTKYHVLISEYPVPGYAQIRRGYLSAYEATLQRSTNKLASVVNTTEDYRGGNNTAEWDGTYRSLLGLPATAISRGNYRKYARNRGTAGLNGCGWNCLTYDIYKSIYWLFVVEYATLNSQAAYNPELTAEGFHQGGLGAGVTNLGRTKWKDFNDSNPFVPCGYTDSLGNGTGVVPFTMPEEYNLEAASPLVTNVPRYRGIENPFGHILKWADGINILVSPTVENGGNDTSKVFVCYDPTKFNDTGYDGYSHVGNEARVSGYIKEIIGGELGEIIPSVCTGASSSTFFYDSHTTSTTNTSDSLRGVLFGGFANHGESAGLAYLNSFGTPSAAYATVNYGSRLCFIP